MDEEAKAVQEIAKATKKGLEVTEKFGAFLSKIFGEGFKHVGDSFADWTIYIRYKNMMKIQDKFEQLHQKRGLKINTISLSTGHALSLLESASREDDDNIQEKWAGLLANSTDPNKRIKIQKIYIEILSSLEPLDALVMDYLSEQDAPIKISYGEFPKINAENISESLSQDISDINLSLSNLFRLGCLIDSWQNQTWNTMARGYQGFRVNNPESDFRLSHLGRMLIEACKTT
jgi:hypothetical protein